MSIQKPLAAVILGGVLAGLPLAPGVDPAAPVSTAVVHANEYMLFCPGRMVEGTASRTRKSRAKRKAKAAWKAAAKRRFGFVRVTWEYGARSKRMTCTRRNPLKFRQTCVARAMPCGYVAR